MRIAIACLWTFVAGVTAACGGAGNGGPATVNQSSPATVPAKVVEEKLIDITGRKPPQKSMHEEGNDNFVAMDVKYKGSRVKIKLTVDALDKTNDGKGYVMYSGHQSPGNPTYIVELRSGQESEISKVKLHSIVIVDGRYSGAESTAPDWPGTRIKFTDATVEIPK